jgi:putative autotransporter adhesin-like protein
MRRFHAAICLSLLAAPAACHPSMPGNGRPATETRPLEGFGDVESKGARDVRVEHGDAFLVAVNIDANLLPLVETHVAGGTLQISTYQHLDTDLPGPHRTGSGSSRLH